MSDQFIAAWSAVDRGQLSLYLCCGMLAQKATIPRRIGALIVGTLCATLVAELLVRQYSYRPQEIHPVLGLIAKAGATLRYTREGNGTCHFLVDGVRRSSPFNVLGHPIVAVGNSFTEAIQVGDNEVYSSVLERRLKANNHELDVLDIGRSGASVGDYVRFASYYQSQFNPRWTIVQLREEDLGPFAYGSRTPAQNAGLRRGPGGELTVVPPTGHSPFLVRMLPVLQRVALVNYAMERLQNASSIFGASGASPAPQQDTSPIESPAADILALLERSYNGRVTFLLLPNFDPDHIDATAIEEQGFDRYCARPAASCVNLRRAYRRFLAEGKSPFGFPNTEYNTGHINADGHAAAGELLFTEILRIAKTGRLSLDTASRVGP